MVLPEHPKGALRSGNIADELARGQGSLEVVVVSPARPIFEGDAHWVTVPVWNRVGPGEGRGLYAGPPPPERLAVGQIGIWPRHVAIVAALGSGLLRIGREGGIVARFAVRGGFLKVGDDKVTILVDSAVTEADAALSSPPLPTQGALRSLAWAEAKRELDETLAALRHPKTDEEFMELLDRRTWCEVRLKLGEP